MAKGTKTTGKGLSIFDIVKKCDDSAELLSESKTAVIPDYISTGWYILNAAMTGSLFKGAPASRVVTLCGESGVGKSYLAVSICREAQKKGYTPIYMDSEGAIDTEFVERLGCDASNFIIKQVTTITEVSSFMANILKEANSVPVEERPKIVFVLDSLGNLTSAKELNDTIEANQKRDMTKQQEVKALFRTNATALAKAGALFIVNSHVYKTQDLFAKTIVSGGCLVEGEEIITENGSVCIEDIKEGDRVLTADGSYQEVLKTFTFEKPTITFTFDDGRTIECSIDHRFLVGNDIYHDLSWVKASELEIGDIIFDNNNSVLTVSSKNENDTRHVYDICVNENHTYVSKNGIINHNSGIQYNSSVTLMLSTAKLDDKESDKIMQQKVGEYVKTGVIVTAKTEKSRFTIPQRVKFQIPFFKAPNPYVGLEAYLTWDNSGIVRGEMLTEKEYGKLSDNDKQNCYPMTDDTGKPAYARPKETSRKIVVKHLGCELPVTELFTSKVITDEILRNLDETVIKPLFELPSIDSNDDIDELINVDSTDE